MYHSRGGLRADCCRHCSCRQRNMIEFFFPNSSAFCPLFVPIAQMGLILPRWGLTLPRTPPSTFILYSAVTNPFWGYEQTQKPPTTPQNTPFPGLNLKMGKMNYLLGKVDPNWAKCLKNGKNFSRSGQKKIFIKEISSKCVTYQASRLQVAPQRKKSVQVQLIIIKMLTLSL